MNFLASRIHLYLTGMYHSLVHSIQSTIISGRMHSVLICIMYKICNVYMQSHNMKNHMDYTIWDISVFIFQKFPRTLYFSNSFMFKTKDHLLLDITSLCLSSSTNLAFFLKSDSALIEWSYEHVSLSPSLIWWRPMALCSRGEAQRGRWGGPGWWFFLMPANPRLFVDLKERNWRNGILPISEAGAIHHFLKPFNT